MSSTHRRNPKYHHHKQSGQARVTLPDGYGGRKDFLLGKYGTAASRKAYDRLIAWWIGNGRRLPFSGKGALSVNEVILAYIRHCQDYYRGPNGKPTQELSNVKAAVRYLKDLYGITEAASFDCLCLKAVRQTMIDADLSRTSINKDVGRVKRCFRWAAGEKLIPATVFHDLQTVEGLRYGRSQAKESEPVQPVPIEDVEAVLPFLPVVVADMVRIQLATGMRAGELTSMRIIDIDTTGAVWLNRPAQHKTQHRGHHRVVAIGPKAQNIIRKYQGTVADAHLFSPRESIRLFREDQRRHRKTPVQPSQESRRKKAPKKTPGQRYTPSTYAQAIQDGIRKAEGVLVRPAPGDSADPTKQNYSWPGGRADPMGGAGKRRAPRRATQAKVGVDHSLL